MNSKKWSGLVLLSMALIAVIVASFLVGDGGSSAASLLAGGPLPALEPGLIAVDVPADALPVLDQLGIIYQDQPRSGIVRAAASPQQLAALDREDVAYTTISRVAIFERNGQSGESGSALTASCSAQNWGSYNIPKFNWVYDPVVTTGCSAGTVDWVDIHFTIHNAWSQSGLGLTEIGVVLGSSSPSWDYVTVETFDYCTPERPPHNSLAGFGDYDRWIYNVDATMGTHVFYGRPANQRWDLVAQHYCTKSPQASITYWGIWVYYTPSSTATPTNTATRTHTRTPTKTYTPHITNTPSITRTPTKTPTITNTPTETTTPTTTPSPTPTAHPGIDLMKVWADVVPVMVGNVADFHLSVENTGNSTWTSISLADVYENRCLEFVEAMPPPDTVDAVNGRLTWNDLTASLGDLAPGHSFVVIVRLRVINMDCGALASNCSRVEIAVDQFGNQRDTIDACDLVQIIPHPPEIEVEKIALDPVVCVGDVAHFVGRMTNVGTGPIDSTYFGDIYAPAYLQSLNDPMTWGPDDGHLTSPSIAWWPSMPTGAMVTALLDFQAKAQTASTVDEFYAVANGDPTTRRSATASVTILSAPGACEGDIVVNGGFESGLSGWTTTSGTARASTSDRHSGNQSLLLGVLPGEADPGRYDAVSQMIQIPADAHNAELSFWFKVDNQDPEILFNFFTASFEVHLDPGVSYHLLAMTAQTNGWQQMVVDLTPYIGHTIVVSFDAFNDGGGVGPLWAFVDDVRVCLSHCGPPMDVPQLPPSGFCWKGSWPDYAPSGVPDFDQAPYLGGTSGFVGDGPAAAANSLWWYDSQFETGGTPPPAVSDSYALVQAYGSWDDHDPHNVAPFIQDLARRVHANGLTQQYGQWIGTRPDDMAAGIRDYLNSKGLLSSYSVTLEQGPAFDSVTDRVRRSEDVLLLLGFWELQPTGWKRLGGHWVTAAGVDCFGEPRIGLSDPLIDAAERGHPGEYVPMSGHSAPHAATLHDDAAYVSHDLYDVWEQPQPEAGARWGLVDYMRRDPNTGAFYPDTQAFWGANVPRELQGSQAANYQGGPIRVGVEYMVAVWRLSDAVTLSLSPASVNTAVGEVFALDLMAESRTQAFDTVSAYLNFDPAALRCVDAAGNPVTALTPGTALSTVLQNAVDNSLGRVNYAARVPLGQAGVTGRVQVARLYFQSLAATAPLTPTLVEFSWSEPRRSDVVSGISSVLGNMSEARVQAIVPAIVQGSVTLQGRPNPPSARWAISLTVELLNPTTGTTLQTLATTTDNQGHFTLSGLAAGVYGLRVKGMHTLANRRSSLTLAAGNNTVNMGTLLEGDTDNDNDVDANDASVVNVAFGSVPSSGNWDPRADLNGDGVVNATDMGLIAMNYGQTGDIELGSSAARRSVSAASLGDVSVQAAGSVALNFLPSTIEKSPGDIFEVQVMLRAGSQPVDTVDLTIFFPGAVLSIVDQAGRAATRVQGTSVFSQELANSVQNGAGIIRYAATKTGGSVTGDVRLFTLRVKAISPGTGWLRFSMWEPRTDVRYRGQSVLGSWPAASVQVRGENKLYLPMTRKK